VDPEGLQISVPWTLPWWTPIPIAIPALGSAIPIVIGVGIVLWPSDIATDESIAEDSICLTGHKKPRPSTWDKHTKRRPGDKEKGDDYRRRPRQRPPDWKGPWPPPPPNNQ
jgi:hypothetical protein